MGLEAVRLGFSKELEAVADPAEREALIPTVAFAAYVYEMGKGHRGRLSLEIDAVIDRRIPRAVVAPPFASAGNW